MKFNFEEESRMKTSKNILKNSQSSIVNKQIEEIKVTAIYSLINTIDCWISSMKNKKEVPGSNKGGSAIRSRARLSSPS